MPTQKVSSVFKSLLTLLALHKLGAGVSQIVRWSGSFQEVINKLLVNFFESDTLFKFSDVLWSRPFGTFFHFGWVNLGPVEILLGSFI